jgi:hypothetical protein
MANAAIVASRRDEIAARWLKGQSVVSIAHELHMPLGTCKHHLALIRRAMVAGQPDVLRLARARGLAIAELVSAQAWRRVDALAAQSEPDDQTERAMIAYLGLVLKTEMHAARLAGLTQPDEQVQDRIVNADLRAEVARTDPNSKWKQAEEHHMAQLMESIYSDVPAALKPRRPASPPRRSAGQPNAGKHKGSA